MKPKIETLHKFTRPDGKGFIIEVSEDMERLIEQGNREFSIVAHNYEMELIDCIKLIPRALKRKMWRKLHNFICC